MGSTLTAELTCTKCGHVGEKWRRSTSRLTQVYLFSDGNIAPVFTKKEWCSACNSRVTSIFVPSHAEINDFLLKISTNENINAPNDQLTYETSVLNRLFIQAEEMWKQWAERQTVKAAKCICGTLTIPLVVALPDDSAESIRFIHPGCGGALEWQDTTSIKIHISWKQQQELYVEFLDPFGKVCRNKEQTEELMLQLFQRLEKPWSSIRAF